MKSVIKRKLNQAESHRVKMEECCKAIADQLQKYFECEIHITYQDGDGFVVYGEGVNDFDAPFNIPVDLILEGKDIMNVINIYA